MKTYEFRDWRAPCSGIQMILRNWNRLKGLGCYGWVPDFGIYYGMSLTYVPAVRFRR